jgi:hypothetical protein
MKIPARDREKHVFAQTKQVFVPNETVFVTKGNETKQRVKPNQEGVFRASTRGVTVVDEQLGRQLGAQPEDYLCT